MIYGDTTLMVEFGSVSITRRKNQRVYHYIGSDRSAVSNLGREATEITCVILAQGQAERRLIEQLLDDTEERDLILTDRRYKSVIASAEFVQEARDYNKRYYKITARFIALNPVAYDITTGEALY